MTRRSTSQATAASVRPGFTLDLGRCVGCGACALACRIENGLPEGVRWRRVLQVNRARINGGPTYHLSVACHHCAWPPCVRACPSGALSKGEDNLVFLNPDRCIGCRYCEMACTFEAPSYDEESGVMTKCHLCHHRLSEGLSPACVSACPTQALGYRFPQPGGQVGAALEGQTAIREGDSVEAEATELPASQVPGFGDPAGADPGFWVAPPGGAIREGWYGELRVRLGLSTEESSDRE